MKHSNDSNTEKGTPLLLVCAYTLTPHIGYHSHYLNLGVASNNLKGLCIAQQTASPSTNLFNLCNTHPLGPKSVYKC